MTIYYAIGEYAFKNTVWLPKILSGIEECINAGDL